MFERDELDLSNIIEESLEEIQTGKSSLEDVLKQHPDLAPLIRSELEVAMWLTASEADVAPRPSFIHASRKRVVDRVRQESVTIGKKRGIFGLALPPFNWQPVAALVLAAFLLISASGLINAARDTVPGEGLYAVKRIHEQVQFGVTFSEAARVVLTTEFSEHRLDEIEALLKQGKPAEAADLFDDFQLEVNRTVSLLSQVDEGQPQVKIEAAQAVQVELSRQALQLEEIQEDAPPEVLAGLVQAHTLAMQGAMMALEVEDSVIRLTATPRPSTAAPSATSTPTKTSTKTPVPPTFTAEPEEESTPEVTQVPVDGTDPVIGGPEDGTPTRQPKATNTPRPTNENRPTEKPPKEEDPPKEQPQPPPDDGGPPKDGQPTKEEKPTNENRP